MRLSESVANGILVATLSASKEESPDASFLPPALRCCSDGLLCARARGPEPEEWLPAGLLVLCGCGRERQSAGGPGPCCTRAGCARAAGAHGDRGDGSG